MRTLAQVIEGGQGPVAIAHVRGEVDASNAAWIGSRLRGQLTNHNEALVVDLTETTYLDSAGISLLFGLASELRLHQQRLHVVVPGDSPIARIVTLAGLGRTVPVAPTLEAALGAG